VLNVHLCQGFAERTGNRQHRAADTAPLALIIALRGDINHERRRSRVCGHIFDDFDLGDLLHVSSAGY
jgi:hypothetical protein